MPDLPTFGDASEAAQQAAQAARAEARTLLPWLPDPPNCPACGALLYASATFDPREAYHVTSWECTDCGDHYPRDPEYGDDRLDGPRPTDARTVGDLVTHD